jgi:hypothetical protein
MPEKGEDEDTPEALLGYLHVIAWERALSQHPSDSPSLGSSCAPRPKVGKAFK